MSTEREALTVTQHLDAWAKGFREAAELHRQAVRDGDPAGIGIARLVGRAEAYTDASQALTAASTDIKYRRRDGHKPPGLSSSAVFVEGIGPPLQQLEEDYAGYPTTPALDVLALIREVYRLRALLPAADAHQEEDKG